MNKMSKKPMFTKAGMDFFKANKSVRKPRACLTRRRIGPIRSILATLKTEGKKGIESGEYFSIISPFFF